MPSCISWHDNTKLVKQELAKPSTSPLGDIPVPMKVTRNVEKKKSLFMPSCISWHDNTKLVYQELAKYTSQSPW